MGDPYVIVYTTLDGGENFKVVNLFVKLSSISLPI